MIEKMFAPKSIEGSIYQSWKASNVFACDPNSSKQPFSIMMPPPNVTGSLHIGHALNSTLQDILARYKRQKGFDVLWQPGTDHAGIATQFVVERQLKSEGLDRKTMGREAFLERVWAWREQSGDMIFNQMERLGISPDWNRARFTMDEGLNKAVRKLFVQMYEEGLVYKDKRLVNWDTTLQTAVSDLEVQHVETKGKLYHIAYALQNDSNRTIVVATSRPETLFGDTAIAVNPSDERYQDVIGQMVIKPLTQQAILIIADDHCDPAFGTGALKVTPAHDWNDFELGKRHNLPFINILNPDGSFNDEVPEFLRGLKADEARKITLKALEECGALISEESITHSVPLSERSQTRIEPYMTEQWFVNVEPMAKKALEAVESGQTRFFPKNWENTYFDWMRNIQPWCISRQIWWGHQIPAWYGPDGTIFVAEDLNGAKEKASAHYGYVVDFIQETDVLDTWFSSALWPFSTLGWPNDMGYVNRYYPTSVLITGFDIIFFWIARMMMMGIYTQKQVPFRDVYIHALVRDEKGQKMSKTKGNVIDPIDIIDEYGADALRLALSIASIPGRDIKMGRERVELQRNFITKIWNATRFLMMQDASPSFDFNPDHAHLSLSKWLIWHTQQTSMNVSNHLEEYRFDLATIALSHFVRDILCDYFLEFMKPVMESGLDTEKQEIVNTAFWALSQVLIMIHPFAPFVSEHLWQAIDRSGILCHQSWAGQIDVKPQESIDHLTHLIAYIRSIRAEYRIVPKTLLKLGTQKSLSELEQTLLKRMARLESIEVIQAPRATDIPITVDAQTYFMNLGSVIDVDAEKQRIGVEIQQLESDLQAWQTRFNNPDFVSRAKESVIEGLKQRIESAIDQMKSKKNSLSYLG